MAPVAAPSTLVLDALPGPVTASLVDRRFDDEPLDWDSLLVSLKTAQGSLGTVSAASLRSRYLNQKGLLEGQTSSGVRYWIQMGESRLLIDLCREYLGELEPPPLATPGARSRLSPLAARLLGASA
jgi:hypothetical protein